MTKVTKKALSTKDAPGAIGPYSQGITVNGGTLICVSGQLPLDPKTGEFVPGGIEELTHQVIDNLEAILSAAGAGLEHVIRTEVFMTDLREFAAMNAVYEKRFHLKPYPARQTVQVSALPRNSRIEISCLAIIEETK